MQENDKPVARKFGERVARLRRDQSWKQKELASRIGCSLQQVSKLERGCWTPGVSVVVRLAETFNVTVDFLLTGREPRRPELDQRLRERLPALERLPEPQRDSLVLFLDGLIMAHRYVGRPLPAGRGEGGIQR